MTIKYLGCDRVTPCRTKAKVCCSLDIKRDIEGSQHEPFTELLPRRAG